MLGEAQRWPRWAKILAVVSAVLCVGAVCYLVNGLWTAIAGATSGLLAWLGLRQRRDTHLQQAAELARRDRERQERDGATAVERAETAAREWLDERAEEAADTARDLAGGDGDPNRVLDRHSAGAGADSSRDD